VLLWPHDDPTAALDSLARVIGAAS
jgi:hypothetical protein